MNANRIRKVLLAAILAATAANSQTVSPQSASAEDKDQARIAKEARHSMPPLKPIRIIVKNGNLSLEGVVDTEGDKNLVNIRAKVVSGMFSVNNNLRVER